MRLIKAAGYTNAGTVEFLVDKQQNFYILEVNARIQVEHPVTELVTGIDLIKEQIRIASGERLAFKQKDDQANPGMPSNAGSMPKIPAKNFAPRPGLITEFRLPGGPGVRMDRHAYAGYRIPPNYDSMIGKLIVHRKTRAEAIATMKRALTNFTSHPRKPRSPCTCRSWTTRILPVGDVDTGFVERVLLAK